MFLLHDESFLVAAIAFVVIAICKQFPSLAGDQQTIIGIVLLLVSLLIGRYTIGNVADAVKRAPTNQQDAIHQIITTLLNDVLVQPKPTDAADPGTTPPR